MKLRRQLPDCIVDVDDHLSHHLHALKTLWTYLVSLGSAHRKASNSGINASRKNASLTLDVALCYNGRPLMWSDTSVPGTETSPSLSPDTISGGDQLLIFISESFLGNGHAHCSHQPAFDWDEAVTRMCVLGGGGGWGMPGPRRPEIAAWTSSDPKSQSDGNFNMQN